MRASSARLLGVCRTVLGEYSSRITLRQLYYRLVAAQKARFPAKKTDQKASSADVAPSETIGTGNAQDGHIPASFSGLLLRSTGDGR